MVCLLLMLCAQPALAPEAVPLRSATRLNPTVGRLTYSRAATCVTGLAMAKVTKYKWRLYADNNVEREVVEHLRRSDMDVLWIAEDPDLQRQQDDAFHYQKARALGRYLLTRDLDFWDDRRHSLQSSPGVIIINTDDAIAARYLPILLRKLIQDYNPLPKPLYLDGVKVRLDSSGVTVKMIDQDTQKVTTDSWSWNDLI